MRQGEERERETFLASVITRAYREGVSGLTVERLEFLEGSAPNGGDSATLTLVPHPGTLVTVTHRTLSTAYRRLRADPTLMYWQTRRRVKAARERNDAGWLQMGDAGLLVQLGVFGEVRA